MMNAWQVGALAGLLTTISMLGLDALTSWPYLVQLIIAVGLTLVGVILTNKLFTSNKTVYQKLRLIEIIVASLYLLMLTLQWTSVINVPDLVVSTVVAILFVLLITTWFIGEKQKEKTKNQ